MEKTVLENRQLRRRPYISLNKNLALAYLWLINCSRWIILQCILMMTQWYCS